PAPDAGELRVRRSAVTVEDEAGDQVGSRRCGTVRQDADLHEGCAWSQGGGAGPSVRWRERRDGGRVRAAVGVQPADAAGNVGAGHERAGGEPVRATRTSRGAGAAT